MAGSQKAHFDHIGDRQLKLFVYLCDVDMRNGPFCFLPADASAAFKDRPIGKGGRFDDDDLIEAGEVVAVTGAIGAAVIVDTTRCLHFGGRSREAERLMLVVQYVRAGDDLALDNVCRPVAPQGLSLSARRKRRCGVKVDRAPRSKRRKNNKPLAKITSEPSPLTMSKSILGLARQEAPSARVQKCR